jgi:hypothetical protein
MKEIHAGYVELILGLDLCLEKFLDKDFTGRRQLQMQRI